MNSKFHDVVFAVKTLDLAPAISYLNDISDPKSLNFRRYINVDGIRILLSNQYSKVETIKYLISQGAEILLEGVYGDYLVARAAISTWEYIFRTSFDSFISYDQYGKVKTYFRARTLSLPKELSDHVHTVLNVKYQSQLRMSLFKTTALRTISDVNTPYTEGMQLGGGIKMTSLSKINQYYGIDRNIGSSKASQSILATAGQSYSPSDLKKFQELSGIRSQTIFTEVGPGISNDTLCAIHASSCDEANLDIQYITSVCQKTPTIIW